MSMNAKNLQDENVERLVKCRLRSEIEARKAVESTMKRAVLEARELKKELVMLRHEKEELILAARKSGYSDASGGKEDTRAGGAGLNTESDIGEQGRYKAVVLKLKQQIQDLVARNADLETGNNAMQQQILDLKSSESRDLEEANRGMKTLSDELKKSKIAIDETKRKCQKMLKEKKEEAQRALQENEQLARCAKTLQSQLALLPQLKKQLEHAKEKRAGVAEAWEKKLEQRQQAFLREEEASKQKLSQNAAKIVELLDEKEQSQTRLEELEHKLVDVNTSYQTKLLHKTHCLEELETEIQQLKHKLSAAETATCKAEKAEIITREAQEQETRLRQLAEDAADAVEARAERAERDLAQAQVQLKHLEEALKARGVTMEFLLKQQTSGSISSQPSTSKGTMKISSVKNVVSATEHPIRCKNMTKSRAPVANKRLLKSRSSNNNSDEV